jgi:hypothetical protein
MNEIEKLHETLKKVQEPKGYYFNKDKERVFELLIAKRIRISSARAYTGKPISGSMGAVTVISMFQRSGTRRRHLMNMSQRGGFQRSCFNKTL